MIDYTKLHSGSTEGSNQPIGPVEPSSTGQSLPDLPTSIPTAPVQGTQGTGTPWDQLGQTLFGRGTGSPLGGVPLLGDAVGAVGNVLSAPLHIGKGLLGAGGEALGHVPLGWLPGGADEGFQQIGDWAKQNDAEMYRQWQIVKTASDADFLGGGNLKADFNMDAASHLDDRLKDSALGSDPIFAMGRSGIGSLGGALSHAIQGWLGLPFDVTSEARIQTKFFDSRSDAEIAAGADSKLGNVSRVDEIRLRVQRGEDLNDVEQVVADHLKDGGWSDEHAAQYLISHGQSDSRDALTQLGASVIYDPLTYLTAGIGGIAKAADVGVQVGKAGLGAATAYERLGVALNSVRSLPYAGKMLRLMRGMVDPLGVYVPKSSASRGLVDLRNGVALAAGHGAYGEEAFDTVRRAARGAGKIDELDSANGAYFIDQANLHMIREVRALQLKEGMGLDMMHLSPDDVVEPMVRGAQKDTVIRLTDSMMQNAKNTFTPEELDNLAGRATTTLGEVDKGTWADRIAKWSDEAKSLFHATTFKMTEKDLMESLSRVDRTAYTGDLPLDQIALLTENNLDNVSAQALVEEQAAIAGKGSLARKTAAWNAAAKRFPAIADIGIAPGGAPQLKRLVGQLEKDLAAGRFHRRALDDELADPALAPIRDMLDRHTVDGNRLWNIGFRPPEDVAMGLKFDAVNGKVAIERDPAISHVIDAVPGRQKFTDVAHNALGQIMSPNKASSLLAPVDSMESFIRTSAQVVSGRRVALNIQRRFEKSTFEQLGLPKQMSKDIFKTISDIAGMNVTTVKGLPINDNLWGAIQSVIPPDFVTPAGHALTIHDVMDHLLVAAEGDMRIIGVTSKMTQRMRNIARRAGIDPENQLGHWTVTMYNKLRYSQPLFLIQRVTDAPYNGALHGVSPMGLGELSPRLKEVRRIEENMARTGTARDFSMDMPEYAPRSNFTEGVRNRFEKLARDTSRRQRIIDAPNTIIANNMTAQINARLGSIVRETLDDVQGIIKDAPEDMRAEMEAELKGPLSRTFDDHTAIYSQAAGRTLDDNEVGLRYIQDQLMSARRLKVGETGIDVKGLLHEGSWKSPSNIGEVQSIHPDELAVELGYSDALAMRKDIHGSYDKLGNLVPGKRSMEWLKEKTEELSFHPDAADRVSRYFADTWETYWDRLAQPVEAGGLDISKHYAREAQEVVARMATARGMDPWEYLSGVMSTNLGGDVDSAMGRLVGFLKAGAGAQPIEEWSKLFRAHLDPSAQETLMGEFEKGLPKAIEAANAAGDTETMQALNKIAALRRGGTAESGGAIKTSAPKPAIPEGFTANPHVAAAGTTSTLPRDGLFHVTTAKDAVMADGFKTGSAVEGFGSKGDVSNADRVSILTNRARATTYLDRIQLAGKAARGEASRDDVIAYFKPLYEKAYGEKAAERMAAAAGDVAIDKAASPQDVYQMMRTLDGGLIGGSLDDAEKAVKLTAPFASAKSWDPSQISMLELASREKAGVKQGLDTGELTLQPQDLHVVKAAGEAAPAAAAAAPDPGAAFDSLFDSSFPKTVRDRIASGVPHPNPEVESYVQHFSKYVQTMLGDKIAEGTRAELRDLVRAVPTTHASAFNRTQALVQQLLKDKINAVQSDVFMLAEMSQNRTQIMRSLNHPLWGIYPSSYMWGKVFPVTMKALARNPYGLTYTIANVQRNIALQREYNPDFEAAMGDVDKSALAFALGYLTPSLPWEPMSVHASPLVENLISGKPDLGTIWSKEIDTTSPMRWFRSIVEPAGEAAGFVGDKLAAPTAPTLAPGQSQQLQSISGQGGSAAQAPGQPISGPVKGTELAPVLSDSMAELEAFLRH